MRRLTDNQTVANERFFSFFCVIARSAFYDEAIFPVDKKDCFALAYRQAGKNQARNDTKGCICNSLNGFTLIEILLVIVLLVTIGGLAIPNLNQTFSRVQLNQTANDMAYLMRYAQSRAVIQRLICQFVLDTENKRYWITQAQDSSQEDSDLNGSKPSFTKISGRLGRALTIPLAIDVQAENPTVQFYPDGRMDKNSFQLCLKNHCARVSTKEQSGYVRVFEDQSVP